MKNKSARFALVICLSLLSAERSRADLGDAMLVTACVGATAYCVVKTCESFLSSHLPAEIVAGLRRAWKAPERMREATQLNRSLVKREAELTELIGVVNSEGGPQLSLRTRPHLFRTGGAPESDDDFAGMARSLGLRAAAAHAKNVSALNLSAPSYVLAQLRSENPRFDLKESKWPMHVWVKDDLGGEFAPEMHLAMYVEERLLTLMIYTNSMMIYNDWGDRKFAAEDQIVAALGGWQKELGDGAEIRFKKFQEGSALISRGLFGPVVTHGLAITIANISAENDQLRANLILLKRMAQLVREKTLSGDPKFSSGYNDAATLDKRRVAEEERKKNPPAVDSRVLIVF